MTGPRLVGEVPVLPAPKTFARVALSMAERLYFENLAQRRAALDAESNAVAAEIGQRLGAEVKVLGPWSTVLDENGRPCIAFEVAPPEQKPAEDRPAGGT